MRDNIATACLRDGRFNSPSDRPRRSLRQINTLVEAAGRYLARLSAPTSATDLHENVYARLGKQNGLHFVSKGTRRVSLVTSLLHVYAARIPAYYNFGKFAL